MGVRLGGKGEEVLKKKVSSSRKRKGGGGKRRKIQEDEYEKESQELESPTRDAILLGRGGVQGREKTP